uniref:Uncharacterized protein n=1 Tax=Rhizophora mucronata TaxID=61149 RepID=A0A2P2NPJ2_RHIMU
MVFNILKGKRYDPCEFKPQSFSLSTNFPPNQTEYSSA